MPMSLTARMVIGAGSALVIFLGVIGAGLEQAFREHAEQQIRDRLMEYTIGLVSLTEPDEGFMPESVAYPRLAMKNSGMFARIADLTNDALWNSVSSQGTDIPYPVPGSTGEPVFARLTDPVTHLPLIAISYSVEWMQNDGDDSIYVFQLAESAERLDASLNRFRRRLWTSFSVTAGFILLLQVLILRWSLGPLRRVVKEVHDVERGERAQLSTTYPRELRILTDNLNQLLLGSRRRLERSRHALADLAHALKTPLAVLRTTLESSGIEREVNDICAEQLVRMDRTVQYQLQRAAASGQVLLGPPVDVGVVSGRLVQALERVHPRIRIEVALNPNVVFRGDEGDLMEILGNLLDNACKWADSFVRLQALQPSSNELRLVVEDDGPGITEDLAHQLLERGARGDQTKEGQGIGLAIVNELVTQAYGGEIVIRRSEWQGACFVVDLKWG